MSVTLLEVIEAAQYDLNTEEGYNWLLGTQREYEGLIEKAQELKDKLDEEQLAESEAIYQKWLEETDGNEE